MRIRPFIFKCRLCGVEVERTRNCSVATCMPCKKIYQREYNLRHKIKRPALLT